MQTRPANATLATRPALAPRLRIMNTASGYRSRVVRRLRPSEALRRLDIISERRAQARRRRLEGPLGDLLDPPGRGHPTEVVHLSEENTAPDADAPGASR